MKNPAISVSQSPPNASPKIGGRFNPWRGACGFYPPDVFRKLKTIVDKSGKDRRVTEGHKATLERMMRRAGKDGRYFAGDKKLAEDLGRSLRTVKYDKQDLVQFGLLETEPRPKKEGRGRHPDWVYFIAHPIFGGHGIFTRPECKIPHPEPEDQSATFADQSATFDGPECKNEPTKVQECAGLECKIDSEVDDVSSVTLPENAPNCVPELCSGIVPEGISSSSSERTLSVETEPTTPTIPISTFPEEKKPKPDVRSTGQIVETIEGKISIIPWWKTAAGHEGVIEALRYIPPKDYRDGLDWDSSNFRAGMLFLGLNEPVSNWTPDNDLIRGLCEKVRDLEDFHDWVRYMKQGKWKNIKHGGGLLYEIKKWPAMREQFIASNPPPSATAMDAHDVMLQEGVEMVVDLEEDKILLVHVRCIDKGWKQIMSIGCMTCAGFGRDPVTEKLCGCLAGRELDRQERYCAKCKSEGTIWLKPTTGKNEFIWCDCEHALKLRSTNPGHVDAVNAELRKTLAARKVAV